MVQEIHKQTGHIMPCFQMKEFITQTTNCEFVSNPGLLDSILVLLETELLKILCFIEYNLKTQIFQSGKLPTQQSINFQRRRMEGFD